MKFKKRLLSIFLSIVFIFGSFSPSISVYASNNSSNNGSNYLRNNFDKVITWSTGVITGTRDLITNFFDYIGNHREDLEIPSGTSTDDWLDDNILINGNGGITISDSVINSMRDVVNNYITNDTGYIYGYSYPVTSFLPNFTDQDFYLAFTQFVSEHQFVFVPRYNSYNTNTNFFVIDDIERPGLTGTINYSAINCSLYNSWNPVNSATATYRYNSSTKEFYLYSSGGTVTTFYLSLSEQLSKPTSNGVLLKVDVNKEVYLVYKNLDALKSSVQGVQDYYITDSYNTNHIDNSMTTTLNDLSNTISYSNVSNYVNSYYIQNQTYPSSQDTYNYINNYDGSGGGSGGGSGSDDDDDDNPFSWIKLLGQFISGLLSGIKEAITGILDVLTSVVDIFLGTKNEQTGKREGGIPSIIGEIISYFLPFLPEWVPTLIEFSIIIAISLGIIKLIRGS